MHAHKSARTHREPVHRGAFTVHFPSFGTLTILAKIDISEGGYDTHTESLGLSTVQRTRRNTYSSYQTGPFPSRRPTLFAIRPAKGRGEVNKGSAPCREGGRVRAPQGSWAFAPATPPHHLAHIALSRSVGLSILAMHVHPEQPTPAQPSADEP